MHRYKIRSLLKYRMFYSKVKVDRLIKKLGYKGYLDYFVEKHKAKLW